jgi:hypothetical protein
VRSSLGDLVNGSELIYFWKLDHLDSCCSFILAALPMLEAMKCADCSGSGTLNGVLVWSLNADGWSTFGMNHRLAPCLHLLCGILDASFNGVVYLWEGFLMAGATELLGFLGVSASWV